MYFVCLITSQCAISVLLQPLPCVTLLSLLHVFLLCNFPGPSFLLWHVLLVPTASVSHFSIIYSLILTCVYLQLNFEHVLDLLNHSMKENTFFTTCWWTATKAKFICDPFIPNPVISHPPMPRTVQNSKTIPEIWFPAMDFMFHPIDDLGHPRTQNLSI